MKAKALPKPAYLGSVVDSAFGQHRIVRITGDPGTPIPNVGPDRHGDRMVWGTKERQHYSLDQAWNADMSLLVLDKSNGDHPDLYLDGRTYRVLFARNLAGGGEVRWHPTDPELRIFVRTNEIGTWNPVTNKRQVLATFPGYSGFKFGPSKGNPSLDGRRIAVHGVDPKGRCVAFAYDLEARRKYPDIVLPSCASYVTISPSGQYIVFHYRDKTHSDTTRIFDLAGNPIGPFWSEAGEPSHFDLAFDTGGDEVAVGVNKNKSGKGFKRQIMRRLTDGAITVLTEHRRYSHTSARNIRRPGWVYVSAHGEIAGIRLDDSDTIERYADPRSAPSGYWSEPQASPSPDGRRIVFASNWGDPKGPISAYVVELCGQS